MADDQPSTAVATDRLLEALAVAVATEAQLADVAAICKAGLLTSTLARRPDLYAVWSTLADLACAVALDHATSTPKGA